MAFDMSGLVAGAQEERLWALRGLETEGSQHLSVVMRVRSFDYGITPRAGLRWRKSQMRGSHRAVDLCYVLS